MTFVVLMRRSFLFEKEQKDMFISLAQKKGTKETSTPSKFDFVFLHHDSEKSKQASLFSRCSIGSPYIGRMQLTPVRDQPLSEFWYDLRSLCPSGKSGCLFLATLTSSQTFLRVHPQSASISFSSCRSGSYYQQVSWSVLEPAYTCRALS